MSYDIELCLDVDTGGEKPYHLVLFEDNITYNLSPMWYAAGWDFHANDGEKAGTIASRVKEARDELTNHVVKYSAMSPDNGWGTYENLLSFFEQLYVKCIEHPNATFRAS